MTDDLLHKEKIPQYTIYKIILNSKVYIGYTKRTMCNRLRDHIYSSRCSTPKSSQKHTIFSHAIRKYGEDNIMYEVLETVGDARHALDREQYYIEYFDSTNREKGYNMLKSSACIDFAKRNKDFYKTESYRRKRSDSVVGVRNGRYSGVTDNQILDRAVEYFKNNNNIHVTNWFVFCKTIRYPQNYDKKTTFRFNGEGVRGFQKQFLIKCLNDNIDITFTQFSPVETAAGYDMVEFFNKIYGKNIYNKKIIKPIVSKEDNKEYIRIIENDLVEKAIEYFLTNGHIHYRKWREYRKRKGLLQSINRFFNREGEYGFRKQFLRKCIQNNIDITLEQFCCFNRLSVLNKTKTIQLYYDHYQKIKNPPQSI